MNRDDDDNQVIRGPDDPISEEEQAAAEGLRLLLERGDASASPALEAVLASLGRPPLSEARHAAILSGALANVPAPLAVAPGARAVRPATVRHASRRAVVATIAFGTLAAAAAVALVVRSGNGEAPPHVSRSTQELFDAPFAVGETGAKRAARVDRVAEARLDELRQNQYRGSLDVGSQLGRFR